MKSWESSEAVVFGHFLRDDFRKMLVYSFLQVSTQPTLLLRKGTVTETACCSIYCVLYVGKQFEMGIKSIYLSGSYRVVFSFQNSPVEHKLQSCGDMS